MGDPDEPHVGLFFFVDGELVILSTPVSAGENDGDFVNDPRGHPDSWALHCQVPGKNRRSGNTGAKILRLLPQGAVRLLVKK